MKGLIFQNLKKFKTILEILANFAQNLAQIKANWYMNGSLFLKKLLFVWVYVQTLWQYISTKTKLAPPSPGT